MTGHAFPNVTVNDACLLIDILEVGLLDAMLSLPPAFHVTDIVVNEITDSAQREVVDRAERANRLTVHRLSDADLAVVAGLSGELRGVSLADCSCLHLVQGLGGALLTGDAALRRQATALGIKVHGTLWVLDSLIAHGILRPGDAARALDAMLEAGSRFPMTECDRRRQQWHVAEE